jgi:hypothetical protein
MMTIIECVRTSPERGTHFHGEDQGTKSGMVQESAFGAFCHGVDRDCPVNHSNMFNRWEKPIFWHLFVILNAAPVPPAASAVGDSGVRTRS